MAENAIFSFNFGPTEVPPNAASAVGLAPCEEVIAGQAAVVSSASHTVLLSMRRSRDGKARPMRLCCYRGYLCGALNSVNMNEKVAACDPMPWQSLATADL